METEDTFDYESFEKDAIHGLFSGKALEGKNGVLAPLIKRLIEGALDEEMKSHISETRHENRRNGKMGKTVKTGYGPVDIDTPRDRNGSFEPIVLPKRRTSLGTSLDDKVVSMYAKGMSYEDIKEHLDELYGLEVSESLLTVITNRVIIEVEQWQNRPLERVYAMVWLDAIHYKVRQDNRIVSKAVYNIMGVSCDGIRDVLGMYVGENEGARFWLQVLSDLKQRGLEDILIVCTDNLKGLSEAIESVFPKTDVQTCVVHQIRNTLKHANWKEMKAMASDLRKIYQAPNESDGLNKLREVEERWSAKYPHAFKSWHTNWEKICPLFHYPAEIRKLMYTTNPIESLHSQMRKITKTKRSFSSDTALIKLLFLVVKDITKKWEAPIKNWNQISIQLTIIFEDRFTQKQNTG
jgi:transposase-like protein